ncbi:efflux RND transporter periplasmic adaptor subunit [Falsigemmobacter faecalis]|uniref:Efflux RND transporter periplasmic adaptor subunit n=1 Tax=Falsigemmobacter faecalis TaxID=2488730 RepID=A0A3P3DZ54_9RHOB|nr:efflux RND transporter periplasmic adaptor subunit [Falsigemmobacter faecalis]RRH78118.1 efflux RND transporter periplasmic adaptor subunit [Falsigemmobacter faecalis]
MIRLLRPAALVLIALSAPLAAQEGALRPVVSEITAPETAQGGRFTGTVEATTSVGVAFELLGRLTSRSVEEGDSVTRGQELARIDTRALTDDRDAARASVESLDATLGTVQRARQRVIELAGRGVAAAAALETAERNEAVARANLEQARATLARAEDALSRAVLRAPFDGIVIQTRHEPGTTIAAGDPVLILASPGGRNVVLTLPPVLLQNAEAGRSGFRVHAPKLPPEGLRGVLLRVDPASVSQTRMRRAWIELGPEAAVLALGELVSVTPERSDAARVTLPEAAIVAGDPPFVWQVADEGGARVLRRLAVTPAGAPEAGRIAVTGVPPGIEVVIRGTAALRDGQRVGPAVQPPGTRKTPLPLTFGEN